MAWRALIMGGSNYCADYRRRLLKRLLGIGQDAQGSLWVVTDRHVLQVDRGRLLSDTLTESDVLSYATDDGLLETEGVRRDRSLVPIPWGGYGSR